MNILELIYFNANFNGAALIVIGILLFELIIFSHEFGHFITAKLSGVKVNEFALGMGPKIISFVKGEASTPSSFPYRRLLCHGRRG